MAILESRQVVVWSVPTLALLLSLYWLGRRRRSRDRDPPTGDPGGIPIDSHQTNSQITPEELPPDDLLSQSESNEESFSPEENQDSGIESLQSILQKEDIKSLELESCEPVNSTKESTETEADIISLSSEEDIIEESAEILEDKFAGEAVPEVQVLSVVKQTDNIEKEIESAVEVLETEPLNEEVLESEPLKEEVLETEPLKEEVLQTEPLKEEVLQTEPLKEEVLETEPLKEEVLQTEPLKEEVLETEPLKEEVLETEPLKEEVCIGEEISPLSIEKTAVEAEVVTKVTVKEVSSALMLQVESVKTEPLIKLASECSLPPVSTEVEGVKEVREEPMKEEKYSTEGEMKEEVSMMEKGVLEKKLASLELDTMKTDTESGKGMSERDSANQSPSEVMLASPSISNFSDAHSEGSSDSGKGHSDVATSPSRTPAGGSSLAGDSAFSVYEFVVPQVMVGRLIGRHGSFIHEVRTMTHTNIFIKRHPDTTKLKICAIEGTQQDIDKAIAKIRQKFPLRKFPKLTLEKVSFVSLNNPPPLKPEDFHLQLVEGVNNDVIVSSLISAAHFFVQQPSHPTYTALSRLNQVMNTVYSSSDAPILENPVKDVICAASTMGGWYRAQIVNVDEETSSCDVRFLDYGGYLSVEPSSLRQIRGDLLMLPFQAVECYLANVAPLGEDGWSEEARLLVQGLTHGQLLQAQIYDYAEDGIPLVYLYSTFNSQIVLINEELVNRGYAALTVAASEE